MKWSILSIKSFCSASISHILFGWLFSYTIWLGCFGSEHCTVSHLYTSILSRIETWPLKLVMAGITTNINCAFEMNTPGTSAASKSPKSGSQVGRLHWEGSRAQVLFFKTDFVRAFSDLLIGMLDPSYEIYVCSRWEKCITLLPCRTRDNPHVSLWSILVQKLQLVFIIQVIKKDIWGLCLDFALLEWLPNYFLFFFIFFAFLCTSLGLGCVRLIFIYFFCSILNLDFFYIYNMWLSSFINYEPLPIIVFFCLFYKR